MYKNKPILIHKDFYVVIAVKYFTELNVIDIMASQSVMGVNGRDSAHITFRQIFYFETQI